MHMSLLPHSLSVFCHIIKALFLLSNARIPFPPVWISFEYVILSHIVVAKEQTKSIFNLTNMWICLLYFHFILRELRYNLCSILCISTSSVLLSFVLNFSVSVFCMGLVCAHIQTSSFRRKVGAFEGMLCMLSLWVYFLEAMHWYLHKKWSNFIYDDVFMHHRATLYMDMKETRRFVWTKDWQKAKKKIHTWFFQYIYVHECWNVSFSVLRQCLVYDCVCMFSK